MTSDGSLVAAARRIMAAMDPPALAFELAERSGYPLYRIHGALRDLVGEGLVAERDGRYRVTDEGAARLAR